MARFTFKSYYSPKVGTFQYSGFCYIGKNASHIEKLVNLYKRGYASERMENVKAELLRYVQENKNAIPEVIICEAKQDFQAIKSFCQFLKSHPALSAIPFLLDATGLTDKELESCKKNTRPDDILFLKDCGDEELKAKIAFLSRIKNSGAETMSPRIEESFPKHQSIGLVFKRMFDILVSSIAICILSPIFLLIALAIKLESKGKGPVFYIAKRAGRGYRIFDFYKFRTMQVGADKKISELTHLNQYDGDGKSPVFFKISNDPRITKIGTMLRNTSLDELPQLINVFLGDMSLVGNRPLPLYEAEVLTTDDYAVRFMAPAGMTGLWQIKKRGNKNMSVEERINIDIDYASNCNFATDLRIIANTPFALLQKENV